jgi:hypothetical protein
VQRVGDRGGVDHRVLAARDRERVAGEREVELPVLRVAGRGALEDRRAEVAGRDLVAGLVKRGDRRRPDLPA